MEFITIGRYLSVDKMAEIYAAFNTLNGMLGDVELPEAELTDCTVTYDISPADICAKLNEVESNIKALHSKAEFISGWTDKYYKDFEWDSTVYDIKSEVKRWINWINSFYKMLSNTTVNYIPVYDTEGNAVYLPPEPVATTVSGDFITVSDVHPKKHDLAVSVKSKNLFDINKAELTGCEIQDNSIVGTASSVYVDVLLPAGMYTISFEKSTDFGVWVANGKVSNGYISDITTSPATFYYDASYDGYLRIKWFGAGNALSDIQIESGTAATDYTPYISDLSEVSVSRLGKNLFDISKITNTSNITNNGDGSLTASAYPSATSLKLKELCPTLKVGDIATLNFDTNGTVSQLYLSSSVYWTRKTAKTITEDILNSVVYFYCKRVDGVNSDATISNIQIELGDTATDYEEYIEPQSATATAEGAVEGLTSISPNMTVVSNAKGVVIDMTYNANNTSDGKQLYYIERKYEVT